MTILTASGTTFEVTDKQVTITRSDQPECTIPLADLLEFLGLFEGESEDDDEA